jgi:ERCC4-type nuclease
MTLTVAVDDREPEGVRRAVEAHADVDRVEVRRLPAADIAVVDAEGRVEDGDSRVENGDGQGEGADGQVEEGDDGRVEGTVGIERKTVDDYASSALGTTGTDLREQVVKMTDAFDHAYILLEGDLSEVGARRPGLNAEAVHGTMASYAARHDTPVVPCSDRRRLVDVAIRLLRKHTEEPGSRLLPGGTVTGHATPTTKRMFGCIEGVGPKTADALYEAFPSVETLLEATREELLSVDGVGEKRADAIFETLRGGRDG